jgi:hypothetical protein
MELLNIFISDYKDSSDDKVDIAVTKLKSVEPPKASAGSSPQGEFTSVSQVIFGRLASS